jgi:photosystem II stability/assembly factor-like uncharacterized protein
MRRNEWWRRATVGAVLALAVTAGFGQARVARAQSKGYDASWFRALKWRNIGPVRGGRSQASAGSPARPYEYYFGAVGGGLWKTIDGGVTWEPVTDGQIHSSSVGAVAVSTSNPDIVYIGMGETCLRGNIMQGDGVYKTTDGGKTWKHMGLADTQAIARIRISPVNPDVVYVAAFGHPAGPNEQRGIFRSEDGGKTWKRVLYRNAETGAIDLSMDPHNPRVLYAALWQAYRVSWKMSSGGPGSGLFKTTDGGDTWTELTRNPGMPKGIIGRIGVSVSGADSSRAYALVEARDGGVFRSDDGGKTWTKTNDERKLRQRAFYYTHIFADPKEKDTVYALNTGFYKSTDGGKTFKTTLRPPHGDNHDLWIDPTNPERMISSDDGGATVSINGGKTWTAEDFPTAQLYHVATTKDFPYQVCGAQQDNSTVCVQSEAPARGFGASRAAIPKLYAVGGGESGYIAPSPKDPNIFYAGSQGALLTRYDRRNGQTRDIEVYPRFFSGEAADTLPDRWQWTFPIVFSPLDPDVLYTSSQFLYKTTTDGQNWVKISPDLTKHDPKTLGDSGGPITHDMNGPEIFGTIFAVAPSYQERGTIWTGSDDGLVYLTRDAGAHWTNVTPPGMPNLVRISLIEASPNRAGTAYVAANNYLQDDRAPYLYKTHDYGKTWEKIVTGIRPDDFLRAVREDPKRPGLLYAGTEHGIYVSFDDGENWQSLSLNLPDTQVPDLEVEDHDLVIATNGRSFYVLDNIDVLRQLTPAVAEEKELHLFAPEGAVRRTRPLAIDYYLGHKAEKVTIEILDAQGKLIRTFAGAPEKKGEKKEEAAEENPFRRPPPKVGIAAGLNRYVWDMRYPGSVTFPGMILWSARAEQGPVAVPGPYQVRVTANGKTETQPFRITEDPRVDVSLADLKAQFDLAMRVREKVSEANEAVIVVRRVRGEIQDRLMKSKDATLHAAGKAFSGKLTAVEEAIYQVKNRSNQDPLNFPIKLNNKIAHLLPVIEGGADAKPTDQTYAAFQELAGELDGELAKLHSALGSDLPAFNKRLAAEKLAPISATEAKK